MALEIGTVIDGKYEIVGVLGQGGMGTVYEGRHQKIHRQVAIKVLKASVAGDEDIVRRFAREAQAAAQIGSSHIVEVYDVGELPSGEHYQILEYLDGESLSQRLKRVRTMAPAEVLPLVIQLLVGLSAAHQAGIVHRDLKPGNIYLARTKDGGGEMVKILDFGISKFHYVDGDD
ncbi:MAG: serine/threonine protein kinase, partial [Deltaproteobacteria bacterium]|nr:serine/threonine protein kinase [Deltaproteobacteria bacterium]